MSLILSIILTFNLLVPAYQQKSDAPPQSKLIQFHMAIMKKGPKWSATRTKEADQLHEAHLKWAVSLIESGKAVAAGPLTDDGDIRGIYIFRASSADDAKAWANEDPAVTAGHLIAEMHPWWSEDVFKKANTPIQLTTVYLAFLARGPFTPESKEAAEELQKAHMANIHRLAGMKKLIVAGPFGDNGQLRGIFVFKVGSFQEAKELTETDPAVKAGRLVLDLHPWQVPEGSLP
jgi:uncharacterized protein YciI